MWNSVRFNGIFYYHCYVFLTHNILKTLRAVFACDYLIHERHIIIY